MGRSGGRAGGRGLGEAVEEDLTIKMQCLHRKQGL